MSQTNGVNTVTPSKPGEQTVEEMANVSKTTKFTVEVNADTFNYLFAYKYARNWFGVLSQAKIDAHRGEWLNEYIAAKMSQEQKQIKQQLKNKAILAAAAKE